MRGLGGRKGEAQDEAFLRAIVEEDWKVGHKTTIGTPQGGCISSVLANILLNELDQLLDGRGHKFVRYADDMVILLFK